LTQHLKEQGSIDIRFVSSPAELSSSHFPSENEKGKEESKAHEEDEQKKQDFVYLKYLPKKNQPPLVNQARTLLNLCSSRSQRALHTHLKQLSKSTRS
jgi:hypothetical protein